MEAKLASHLRSLRSKHSSAICLDQFAFLNLKGQEDFRILRTLLYMEAEEAEENGC